MLFLAELRLRVHFVQLLVMVQSLVMAMVLVLVLASSLSSSLVSSQVPTSQHCGLNMTVTYEAAPSRCVFFGRLGDRIVSWLLVFAATNRHDWWLVVVAVGTTVRHSHCIGAARGVVLRPTIDRSWKRHCH